VHLSSGDRGVCTLFRKAFQLLRRGGRFLVQPQPWSAYHDKARMSRATYDTYASIRLRPDAFRAYLVDKVGFQLAAVRPVKKRSGATRDLLVFMKP
jgi:7SK snRNA methylphosphate capping enzyme